jgi:hypothetical protein
VSAYQERIAVPVRWWVLAALGALAIALVSTALPVFLLVANTVLAVVGLAVALRASTLHVVVDDEGLGAGRARLPWSAIGTVVALDATAAAALRSRDADPRAYLALRGWVGTAVRVDVDDPADPTPYWYVSTRHPTELAAALTQRPGTRADRNDTGPT